MATVRLREVPPDRQHWTFFERYFKRPSRCLLITCPKAEIGQFQLWVLAGTSMIRLSSPLSRTTLRCTFEKADYKLWFCLPDNLKEGSYMMKRDRWVIQRGRFSVLPGQLGELTAPGSQWRSCSEGHTNLLRTSEWTHIPLLVSCGLSPLSLLIQNGLCFPAHTCSSSCTHHRVCMCLSRRRRRHERSFKKAQATHSLSLNLSTTSK